MSDKNADQIEYWNAEGGLKWVENQLSMDRTLAPFSDIALDALRLRNDETVIDIGCGCGGTSLLIAELVKNGSVLGLDISAPMLKRANERKVSEGKHNVEFCESDAATHKFDELAVDALFSRFGVMFFDEPVSAFSNMRRALKDTGRIGFVCWQPLLENQWMTVPLGAALPHLPEMPKPEPRAPGPFAFGERDYVIDIMEKSGFTNIAAADRRAPMQFFAEDLHSMARNFVQMGPLGRVLGMLEEKQQRTVLDAMSEAMEPHFDNGTLSLEGAVHLVTAENG